MKRLRRLALFSSVVFGCGGEEAAPPTVGPAAAAPLASSCLADLEAGRNVVPGRYIVAFRPDKVAFGAVERLTALSRKATVRAPLDLGLLHAVAADLDAIDAERLGRDPDVAYVEPDGLACAFDEVETGGADDDARPRPPTTTTACASASSETTPTGILEIGATARLHTGLGVIVAVVDTGIDLDHADLAANVSGGTGFVGNTTGDDDHGHGSHVAGTVAAVAGNNQGVVGVAPQAGLLAVKVLDRRGSGTYSNVAAGVDWAVQNGAGVINLSLGGTFDSATLRTAIESAHAAGVFVAAAAGNSGADVNDGFYPAAYDHAVITVSAEDPETDGFPTWSNYGVPPIDVAGPGVAICSTSKSGAYKSLSGTSMATPHVAGTAALVLEGAPATPPFTVRDGLVAGAIPLADTSLHTEDLVNAAGQ